MHTADCHEDKGVTRLTFYHNPRCSKSRKALELLRARNVEPAIVEYLTSPPSVSELDAILNMLEMEPRQLMRRGEPIYKDLALDDESLDHHSLLQAMVEHPILIERPIVVADGRAALGRPPENVLELL